MYCCRKLSIMEILFFFCLAISDSLVKILQIYSIIHFVLWLFALEYIIFLKERIYFISVVIKSILLIFFIRFIWSLWNHTLQFIMSVYSNRTAYQVNYILDAQRNTSILNMRKFTPPHISFLTFIGTERHFIL